MSHPQPPSNVLPLATNRHAPVRILVRAPNWIGDQVLAFPFFHYLRKTYPNAHIAVSCAPWVESVQFRHLIDVVYPLPRLIGRGWRARLEQLESAAKLLRESGPWDLAIALPNSFSAAYILWRAGAKKRRGYDTEGRFLLMNSRVRWDDDPAIHRAQAYLKLLPDEAQPRLPVSEFWGIPPENPLDEPIPGELLSFDGDQAWPVDPAHRLAIPTQAYWVLAPGATAESRRWPKEYFLALARKVAAETGLTGLIVGGPKEAPLAEELSSNQDAKLLDFTARGPVSALFPIFRNARFTVTNESGLAHVAALCGSPVQIVCGAADPRRTRPLGPGAVRVAINPVECWPCERNTCSQPPGKKIQCLTGILPATVWEEVKRVTAQRDSR